MAARDDLEYDFLREHFKDLKEGQIRLEDKFDLLRDSMDIKVQNLSDKIQGHDQQLSKHSQLFSLASLVVTTGLAGMGGLCAWIYENFVPHK